MSYSNAGQVLHDTCKSMRAVVIEQSREVIKLNVDYRCFVCTTRRSSAAIDNPWIRYSKLFVPKLRMRKRLDKPVVPVEVMMFTIMNDSPTLITELQIIDTVADKWRLQHMATSNIACASYDASRDKLFVFDCGFNCIFGSTPRQEGLDVWRRVVLENGTVYNLQTLSVIAMCALPGICGRPPMIAIASLYLSNDIILAEQGDGSDMRACLLRNGTDRGEHGTIGIIGCKMEFVSNRSTLFVLGASGRTILGADMSSHGCYTTIVYAISKTPLLAFTVDTVHSRIVGINRRACVFVWTLHVDPRCGHCVAAIDSGIDFCIVNDRIYMTSDASGRVHVAYCEGGKALKTVMLVC